MQVYNTQIQTKQFTRILDKIRSFRKFNTSTYIAAKATVINDYFAKNGLNTAVVAVSGGIDSACVLTLIKYASSLSNSPIANIVPVTLPLLNRVGATNQSESIAKARQLCESQGLELRVMQIGEGFDSISTEVVANIGKSNIKTDPWALGQLTAYARTPYLYYSTSVLTSEGKRAIIVGTTNRDEGAYLGYVGKASDAMVDIQIISDIHKSEVFKVSKTLGVPQSILEATPSGDMYDSRNDEKVFGASYDFVEIYINYLNMSEPTQEYLISIMDEDEKEMFFKMKDNIENLHNYNRHKYFSGSQAVHLDVMRSSVKGGWIDMVHTTPHKVNLEELNKPIFTNRFSGFVDSHPTVKVDLSQSLVDKNVYTHENHKIHFIEKMIDKSSASKIASWFDENLNHAQSTDKFGSKVNNSKSDISTSAGQNRLSFYDEALAKSLFEKISIQSKVENLILKHEDDRFHFTNFGESKVFRLVGVNPMFRVIQYNEGDFLVPHYDDAWVKNKFQRSLKTLIIGVDTDSCIGGETQFIQDSQNTLSYKERNFSDKEKLNTDVFKSIKLGAGEALIFDHRILHQGNNVISGKKTIIRTELIYESCDFLKE